MGTRAMISINGKPIVTTHWDGYPENLGLDLLKVGSESDIIDVAKKYSINSVDPTFSRRFGRDVKWFGEYADLGKPMMQTDTEYWYDLGSNGIWTVSKRGSGREDKRGKYFEGNWERKTNLSKFLIDFKIKNPNSGLGEIPAFRWLGESGAPKTKMPRSPKTSLVNEHIRKTKRGNVARVRSHIRTR